MIIHKLLLRFFRHGDDDGFYLMQAQDSIRWLKQVGVKIGPGTSVLDLGCGHGVFGSEFARLGCDVTFADQQNNLRSQFQTARFLKLDLDQDDYGGPGRYDLVVCSNVFEHLAKPHRLLSESWRLLRPEGKFYLSWTNWLSPFGGHEFSPFHFLGAQRGHLVYDRLIKRKRNHTPFENLYPTYIGHVLGTLRRSPTLQIERMAPRYYTEFPFLLKLPGLREFLAWNCALLLCRKAVSVPPG
jgi:SAM-dependent methyltransferase